MALTTIGEVPQWGGVADWSSCRTLDSNFWEKIPRWREKKSFLESANKILLSAMGFSRIRKKRSSNVQELDWIFYSAGVKCRDKYKPICVNHTTVQETVLHIIVLIHKTANLKKRYISYTSFLNSLVPGSCLYSGWHCQFSAHLAKILFLIFFVGNFIPSNRSFVSKNLTVHSVFDCELFI